MAHGKFDYRAVGNGGTIENDFSATGYLVGLGVERAIGENWSVRGEYQYTNYGSEELTDPAGFSTKATPQDHRLSLGLLWRF